MCYFLILKFDDLAADGTIDTIESLRATAVVIVKIGEFVSSEVSSVDQSDGHREFFLIECFELMSRIVEQDLSQNRKRLLFGVRDVRTEVLSIVDVMEDKGGVRKLGRHT
jgi:hypothetical protein